MGNSVLLANQLISQTKVSLIKKTMFTLQWKYASFIERQKMIDEYINTIITALGSFEETASMTEIARNLLSYKNKSTLPTKEDIYWLCEVITALQNESSSSLIEVENYYVLIQFLRELSNTTDMVSDVIHAICKQYIHNYPESLLIPAEELKSLLTTTALYYPEMEPEYIVQSVCGIIKLAVRFAELAKKDSLWEDEIRKELCQIHSLNIHICLLLEDSELLYFLEESETESPEDVVRVIIQQLTLEEIYRKYGEESMFFSKVNTLIPSLSPSIYYGKYSPIFTLYNYMEASKEQYPTLFTLPLQYFTEFITLLPCIASAKSYIELSCALSHAEDIACIFCSHSSLLNEPTQKQKAMIATYAAMSKETIQAYKCTHLNDASEYTVAPRPSLENIIYPEYSVVFSFIESILSQEEVQGKIPSTFPKEYDDILLQVDYNEQYTYTLSLLLFVMEENSLLQQYSHEERIAFIDKIAKTCGQVLAVAPSIFYSMLTDMIKKYHTIDDISTLLSYCCSVIDIANKERLQVSTIGMAKEQTVNEENSAQYCDVSNYTMLTTEYQYHSKRIQ